jgi:hypothetical protein
MLFLCSIFEADIGKHFDFILKYYLLHFPVESNLKAKKCFLTNQGFIWDWNSQTFVQENGQNTN